MKNLTKGNIIKTILLTLGVLIIINAVVLLFISNYNVGAILIFIVGAGLFINGLFWGKIVNKILKIINSSFFIGLIFSIGLSSFLLLYGNINTVTYNENAIIVLGSGIRGEKLTKSLKARLDIAIEYHKKNPKALIVLSGGKGPQEDITESLAMESYMLSKGVTSDKILKEDLATSTYENFLFSKQLLDSYFNYNYSIAFVSTNYHIYRATQIAKTAGFSSVTHEQSAVQWYSVVPTCLRECLAVIKLWVLGN